MNVAVSSDVARPQPLAEAALLDALGSLGYAVTIFDVDGRIVCWSQQCETLLGWRPDQVVGYVAPGLVTKATQHRLLAEGRAIDRTPAPCADGSEIMVQSAGAPMYTPNGTLTGFIVCSCPVDAPEAEALLDFPSIRPGDGVALCTGSFDDPSGPHVVYVSDGLEHMIGRAGVDLVGHPLADLTAGDAAAAALLAAGRRLGGQRVVTAAVGITGAREPFDAEVTLFSHVGTTSPMVLAVVRDLAPARETAERLRLAADLAGVGCWELNIRSRNVAWDDRTALLLGYERGTEASWPRWLAALSPEDRAGADRRVQNLADGESTEVMYRVRRADGTIARLLSRWRVAERDLDGPVRLAGVLIDVTDAEAAADHVRSTLEAMSEAYFALDRELRYVYINGKAAAFLGRGGADVIGRSIEDVHPFELTYETQSILNRVLAGETVECEVHSRQHDMWLDLRAYPIPVGLAVHFRDVTERKRAQEELAHAASHDDLTGLPNRVALESWLARTVLSSRPRGRRVAVLFCDIDRFKLVNDSLGHAAGDDLLMAVAARLSRSVRPEDIVARYGGDEFVLALASSTPQDAEVVANRILEELREPIEVAGRRFVVTASIGIAIADHNATPETLLRDADAALFRAKDGGRDQVARFDDEVRAGVVTRLQVAHDLREALAEEQLRLHFQPGFDLQTGEVAGVEALLRWEHPSRGLLAAGAFIDLADEAGLIGVLGDWVVPAACATRAANADMFGDLVVWVNVSPGQLARPGFARHFLDLIRMGGAPATCIGIEVTETALADDDPVAIDGLAALHRSGVQIAIDDFGTGYSSIARLRRYPVDVLKLDRAFTADLLTPAGRGVAAAVVELAHAVGALALAEGVETQRQLEVLRELGCDRASGFHLARPMDVCELARVIAPIPVS